MVPASTSAASSGVVALLRGDVLGCFLLWFVSSGWKHFFVLRRSDDGIIDAVSFLRVSLWKSWAFVACGVVSSWRWKIGRSFRSLVFFFFIVVVVLSYFLFVSV
jgi:hypothetical protein